MNRSFNGYVISVQEITAVKVKVEVHKNRNVNKTLSFEANENSTYFYDKKSCLEAYQNETPVSHRIHDSKIYLAIKKKKKKKPTEYAL